MLNVECENNPMQSTYRAADDGDRSHQQRPQKTIALQQAFRYSDYTLNERLEM
jgi:hypothetical protein